MTADLRTLATLIDALGTTDPAVVECAMDATRAACRNRHPLVDFKDFVGAEAL